MNVGTGVGIGVALLAIAVVWVGVHYGFRTLRNALENKDDTSKRRTSDD